MNSTLRILFTVYVTTRQTLVTNSNVIVTSPENAVDEALEGLVMLHPGLRLLQDHRVVVREKVIKQLILVRKISM